jgi:hypothetical protein
MPLALALAVALVEGLALLLPAALALALLVEDELPAALALGAAPLGVCMAVAHSLAVL